MSETLFELTVPKYPALFWGGDSECEIEKFNKLVGSDFVNKYQAVPQSSDPFILAESGD